MNPSANIQECVELRNIPNETEHGVVIAAGPLVKQPHTVAFRIVLVRRDDQDGFVVWTQQFRDWPVSFDSNMANGDYFNEDELHLATAQFAKRISSISNTIKSIYRETM